VADPVIWNKINLS